MRGVSCKCCCLFTRILSPQESACTSFPTTLRRWRHCTASTPIAPHFMHLAALQNEPYCLLPHFISITQTSSFVIHHSVALQARADFVTKLTKMDFPALPNDVFSSAYAAAMLATSPCEPALLAPSRCLLVPFFKCVLFASHFPAQKATSASATPTAPSS